MAVFSIPPPRPFLKTEAYSLTDVVSTEFLQPNATVHVILDRGLFLLPFARLLPQTHSSKTPYSLTPLVLSSVV
jgi:inactivated superfamily I helicase